MVKGACSQSRIEAHTKVLGDLRGTGELCILGTCKGDMQIQGRVTVQGGGLVKGNIEAQEIEVQGVVMGELSAQASIILGPNARVVGALTAPRIEILQGAQFQGPLQTQMPQAFGETKAESSAERRKPDSDITQVTQHQELASASAGM